MPNHERLLVSGNEAIALACLHAGVRLGTGYPGTPSTEILESFSELGGRAQWAPNEKVAFEVALGAAFGGARTLVTMKHVGLNVAADPLFTATYTGVTGGMVVVCADDPGMASSQNEQDNRHYAAAARIPMLEPADSQEAYDFPALAFELSERWGIPVLLRPTTRVCHSKTVLVTHAVSSPAHAVHFERNIPARVMVPGYARAAHARLLGKIAEFATWSETAPVNRILPGDRSLGIVTSGVAFTHAREAAPTASILKLGMTWPLPEKLLRQFAASVDRLAVIEEGDPILWTALRALGIAVDGKPEAYRLGELTVDRARRILAGDASPEPAPLRGSPAELCKGCPHRVSFETLRDLKCIVTGDIGCYTLGVMAPFEAMDTCVCMGASIGVGLGLRHVLPEAEARRVVSVIGDSTFMHSGLTGLADMVYNPPPTGHIVMILDNSTTAMTGLQEHAGTGRSLNHEPAHRIACEDVARAMGVRQIHVIDPLKERDRLVTVLTDAMQANETTLIVMRRPCLLAASKIREYEQRSAGKPAPAGS